MASNPRAALLINAPVEKVFRYFIDPEKQLEWQPTDMELVEIQETRRLANGGWYQRGLWRQGGKVFAMSYEDFEVVPHRVITSRVVAPGRDGIFRTTFEQVAATTLVTVEAEPTGRWTRRLRLEIVKLPVQRLLARALERAKAAIEGRPLPRTRAHVPLEMFLVLGGAGLVVMVLDQALRGLGAGLLADHRWSDVALRDGALIVLFCVLTEVWAAALRRMLERRPDI
jgi:uncharacterized protein YndB with AHSA1/START domain